jgi:ribonucleotide reductase beta subunit family protein with ferritin-like domain
MTAGGRIRPGRRSGAVPSVEDRAGSRFERLLDEIDALIDDDETADRRITGAWKTFAEINAAADEHVWDAYSVDLSVDADSYRKLDRDQKEAMLRVFGTIYRAESIVDDWMDKIVAAIPRDPPNGAPGDGMRYDAMRAALKGQEHDEKMHRGSLFRVGVEVLGLDPKEVEHVAKKHNNFVAETLFARFNQQMRHLLRPGRPLEDVYTAIFIYGILSEDVVANSDVVIRRAKSNSKYDEFNLPGMKEGQTNVRRDEGRHVRIAVLATHKFLSDYAGAEERLLEISTEYMDLADRMLRQAKRSHGLIDAHLRESYGPDVDSLYYYVMNMKRLAVRLDELGLQAGVRDVRDRVARAVAEFTDERRQLIVEEPSFVFRRFGPYLLRFAGSGR